MNPLLCTHLSSPARWTALLSQSLYYKVFQSDVYKLTCNISLDGKTWSSVYQTFVKCRDLLEIIFVLRYFCMQIYDSSFLLKWRTAVLLEFFFSLSVFGLVSPAIAPFILFGATGYPFTWHSYRKNRSTEFVLLDKKPGKSSTFSLCSSAAK